MIKKWHQFNTHRIDKLLNQFISKKFTVFAIGCFFLYQKNLREDNWTILACVYLFGQTAFDLYYKCISKRSR